MNIENKAYITLKNIYCDGDVDYLFIWELINCVDIDEHYDEIDTPRVYKKTSKQIKNDLICLIDYLVGMGDFVAYDALQNKRLAIEDIFKFIEDLYKNNKLLEIGFDMSRVLLKEKKGKEAPTIIPDTVMRLFI